MLLSQLWTLNRLMILNFLKNVVIVDISVIISG